MATEKNNISPQFVKDWYSKVFGKAPLANTVKAYQKKFFEEPDQFEEAKATLWPSTAKSATKVDPAVVKSYLSKVWGEGKVSAKDVTEYVSMYKVQPEKYASVVDWLAAYKPTLAQLKSGDSLAKEPKAKATGYKVDPKVVKDYCKWMVGGSAPSVESVKKAAKQMQEVPTYYMTALQALGMNVPLDVVAAAGKQKDNDSGVDPAIIKKYHAVVNGKVPSAADLKKYVKVAQEYPEDYASMVADVKKWDVEPKGTFLQRIKALKPATLPSHTYNDAENDLEVLNLKAAVKSALTAKYSTWKPEYKNVWNHVTNLLDDLVDPAEYMREVVKILNPNYKPPTMPKNVKPGEFHSLPVPPDELSAKAKGMMPNADTAKKKLALEEKIKAFEAEIARLKKAQKAATTGLDTANTAKKNLAGIDEKLLKYFSYIEKNCGDFLKAVKTTGKFLYRGQDDAASPVFVGYPRADREPKDSNEEAQRLLDQYMLAKGFKALRSNSIFTSSDKHQADHYGTAYAIFPKNGFSYTWSTKEDDLVIHSVSELHGGSKHGGVHDEDSELYYESGEYVDDMNEITDIGNLEDHLMTKIENKKGKDLNTELKIVTSLPQYKALVKVRNEWSKLNEDDAKCKAFIVKLMDAYYELIAVYPTAKLSACGANTKKKIEKYRAELTSDKTAKANPDIEKKGAEVIKRYGFVHDNLDAALKAGHEVCILGEYVAVKDDLFRKQLSQYFLGK